MTESLSPILTASEAARLKLADIIEEADATRDTLFLRMFVQGGGCSGFQYGFQMETEKSEDDLVVDYPEVCILIDSMSLQYLFGASLEYADDLEGERFIIKNPNAGSTCGCGSSFSA